MDNVQFLVTVPCTDERYVAQKLQTMKRILLAGFGGTEDNPAASVNVRKQPARQSWADTIEEHRREQEQEAAEAASQEAEEGASSEQAADRRSDGWRTRRGEADVGPSGSSGYAHQRGNPNGDG